MPRVSALINLLTCLSVSVRTCQGSSGDGLETQRGSGSAASSRLRRPVGRHASVGASADAELVLREAVGHSGLSITATPACVRERPGEKELRAKRAEPCGFTSVAASVAHVGGDQTPLVCCRVVKLHGRKVAGAVVPSDDVQQPVDGTDT